MKFEQATPSDLDAIRHLLESYGLPANDIKGHLDNFIVVKESNVLIGVGGWESCKEVALLRSLAVNTSHKGLAVAEKMLKLLEEQAANSGVRAFYLLTDTATNYFERFDFNERSRENAPESIRKTKQFSELCPHTATMMYKKLCA
jgi:N-acetylglutamate synthase-like GNAT family acetyltransferase